MKKLIITAILVLVGLALLHAVTALVSGDAVSWAEIWDASTYRFGGILGFLLTIYWTKQYKQY